MLKFHYPASPDPLNASLTLVPKVIPSKNPKSAKGKQTLSGAYCIEANPVARADV